MTSSLVRLTQKYWLALLFGTLHAMLAGTAVVIQLLGAWNDMNPTMIVLALFRFVDYPLVLLANAFADPNGSSTPSFIFVAIAGTIAWTLIGMVVQSAWLAVGHTSRRRLTAS